MTKKQRIGFWSILGLFILPEVLWSPVGNFIYSLLKPPVNGSVQVLRNNFLLTNKYDNFFSAVLFIQLLGLFASAVYLIVMHNSVRNKWLLWPSMIILLFSSVVVFYLFGFSITLRNIGF